MYARQRRELKELNRGCNTPSDCLMGAYAEINLHVEDVTCEPSSARLRVVDLGHTSTAVRQWRWIAAVLSRTNYVR